jgi:hypothetical protein
MDDERMASPHRPHYFTKQVHILDQQVVPLPLQQVDSEEVSSARMPGATVIRHGNSIAGICIRRNALRLLSPYETSHKAHAAQQNERAGLALTHSPLLNPLPQAGEEANVSLREFHVNDAGCRQ